MARNRWFALIVLAAAALCATGQEQEDTAPPARPGLALGETVLVNGVLSAFNRFVTQVDYAQVDLDSIKTNLNAPWVWDRDDFLVNHVGHPYHGSYYFDVGRSNGLSFYPSTLMNMAGSISWELFCENEIPSRNDFITTTVGGAALGEMFHKLYLVASQASFPLAFLISPMDGLNRSRLRAVRERHPPKTVCSLALGVQEPGVNDPDDFPVALSSEIDIEYGNPYGADSRIPYQSFEQRWLFGASLDSYRFGFFSDGFLRSWALADDDRRRTSAGISLHYDALLEPDFVFSANSVGATLKHERTFAGKTRLRFYSHVNWILLGASDNSLLREEYEEGDSDEERRVYDLSTGLGVELGLAWKHPEIGNLFASIYDSFLGILPDSAVEEGYRGKVFVEMLRLSYERGLSSRWYTGLSAALNRKRAFYRDYDSTPETKATVDLYVKRLFL